jgi:hypothetical protein
MSNNVDSVAELGYDGDFSQTHSLSTAEASLGRFEPVPNPAPAHRLLPQCYSIHAPMAVSHALLASPISSSASALEGGIAPSAFATPYPESSLRTCFQVHDELLSTRNDLAKCNPSAFALHIKRSWSVHRCVCVSCCPLTL